MMTTCRRKILVVEDSITASKRLQLGLEQAGFAVEVACDGHDAWSKATAASFDFVVTDEQMPNMSGQELVRRLRSDDRYADTPIVFITASRAALDIEELRNELGVVAIMEKPFNPQLVSNFVSKHLARRVAASL